MLVSVLTSGSKGNSTLIKTKNKNILIDAGTTIKYINDSLKKHETKLSDINYIFITHTHTDHVSALLSIIKKYNPCIVLTDKMLNDLPYLNEYNNLKIISEDFEIENIKIEVIKTSHDTSDSRGYIITEESSSVVLITDTGYINQKYFEKIKNKNLYIFESNYDTELLMNGRYPKWLQKRVNSDEGHLSNEMSAFYLSKIIGENTKKIILAHLSEENNSEELALEAVISKLENSNIKFNNITVAKQNIPTELYEI